MNQNTNYNRFNLSQYIDVQNVRVIALKVEHKESARITLSQVLPEFKISVLTEAIVRSKNSSHTEVTAWLMQQFQ
ncbi:MAG: hypothetical protein ACRC80_35435 [Waterburya sp.]